MERFGDKTAPAPGGPAPRIEGTYHDPLHGGVARSIRRHLGAGAHDFDIAGAYSGDETLGGVPAPGAAWSAKITVGRRVRRGSWEVAVDFSGKRGPGGGPHADLTATFTAAAPAAIVWDTDPVNTWTRVAPARFTCFA